jgi:uncharacterized cupin superfamily protein
MIDLQDIEIIEGETTATTQQYYETIQKAINTGMWGLQGSYGRTMMEAINEGYCMLGHNDATDYYGNHIPSRDQVKAGTKGSYEYVAKAYNEGWAQHMSEVE